MEQAVEQHRIESKTFEVKMNQVLNENERLLEQVMSKDIVNLLVNPFVENDSVNVHECQKCLKLKIELQTNFVKRETYDKLLKMDTPIVEKSKLDEDKERKAVDPSHYRGMIGTLLYLTASRPDLQFAICMCARYQARPTEKHLNAVKRIFRYLKGTVHRGLWYPKDSLNALTSFADADHAGCQDTHRSTSGSMQLLGDRLVSWSSKRQKSAAISSTEAEYIALSSYCAQILWLRYQVFRQKENLTSQWEFILGHGLLYNNAKACD
ncbi:hypothetical protein Tco_1446238 [Tanacetum coccineum]